MANTYVITAPDGKKYKITAPPGASQADAMNYVKSNIDKLPTMPTGQSATPAQPKQSEQSGMLDSLKNSFLGGAVRGARDIVDGGAQLATRTLEGLPSALGVDRHPAGQKFQETMQEQRENVENINQAAEQDYRQNWRQGEDVGLDGGRIAGNIAASLPLAYAVPGMAATSMAGKTAYGVGAGMTGAAFQPVQQGKDFQSEKLAQLMIGGALGGTGVHVGEAVGKVAGKVMNRAKRAITPNITREQTIRVLNQNGVDLRGVTKATREDLIKQAQQQLDTTGNLSGKEIAAKADFDSLGMQPTKGQLSRDPQQFRFEQNTQGIDDAGRQLTERFTQQNQQLIGQVNKARTNTGGVGMDDFQAGQRGIDVLKDVKNTRGQAVGELYDEALNNAGVDTLLDSGRFTKGLKDTLDDMLVSPEELPAGVNRLLKNIESGDTQFTIKKAEQVRKAINKRMGASNPQEKFALKTVNDAIQKEIDAFGSTAGEAFKTARGAAAENFSKIDANPAMQAISKDLATPDDFIKKYLHGSKVGPLMQLKKDIMEGDPAFWNELRGQTIDHLKTKSTGDVGDEFAKFSQSGYNKALNQIGNKKLKVLFSADEIKHLRTIGNVGKQIQNEPLGASVNRSNTGAAIANLLSRAGKIPLAQMVADPIQRGMVQRQVGQALNPQLTMPQQIPGLSPQAMSRLNLPFAIGGYPLVQPGLDTGVNRQ